MINVALITGASSGIGRELARLHAQRGGDLVLVARRKNEMEYLADELSQKYGIKTKVISEDLTDEEAPQRIFDRVTAAGIDVQYLINNAGFGARGKFHEQDWENSRAMIQVNAIALANLTRLFLPGFVDRGSGRIMNVTSTAALQPGPMQAVYFATKAFGAFLSNALAEELSDTCVTVTNFMPTATATEFASTSGMEKTSLFKNAKPAAMVAEDGYNAMMFGHLDAYGGMRPFRRFQYWLVRQLPKRRALKIVRRVQEA